MCEVGDHESKVGKAAEARGVSLTGGEHGGLPCNRPGIGCPGIEDLKQRHPRNTRGPDETEGQSKVPACRGQGVRR